MSMQWFHVSHNSVREWCRAPVLHYAVSENAVGSCAKGAAQCIIYFAHPMNMLAVMILISDP
ncbi:MAG: hypothetical protein OIF55_05875, partial [Amphritea sp.]|nr:hypothetical protein [Amphritea sp.]